MKYAPLRQQVGRRSFDPSHIQAPSNPHPGPIQAASKPKMAAKGTLPRESAFGHDMLPGALKACIRLAGAYLTGFSVRTRTKMSCLESRRLNPVETRKLSSMYKFFKRPC